MGKEAYRVHSAVMSVHTRTTRHRTPGKMRWVQHIGGGEIKVRRKRPASVKEDALLKHLDELKRLEGEGKIVVRTASGLRVNLETLDVEKPPPPKPMPARPKDTISKDIYPVIEPSPAEAVDMEPQEVSMALPVVTHSEDKDPAKRRKKGRKRS